MLDSVLSLNHIQMERLLQVLSEIYMVGSEDWVYCMGERNYFQYFLKGQNSILIL